MPRPRYPHPRTLGGALLLATVLLTAAGFLLLVRGHIGWAQLLFVVASGTAGGGVMLLLEDHRNHRDDDDDDEGR